MLISQSNLEAKLGRSLTNAEVSIFTILNSAVQSYVENFIGTGLESTTATTRYYDGGVQHLSIDPCTDITSVTLVDDYYAVNYTYLVSDYTVEPMHKTLKRMLRNRGGAFMTGINNIAVTAKYSIYADTETLAIVKNAMLEFLVSEMSGSDDIVKESIEGYSVEFATTEAKDALAGLKYLFPQV